MHQGHKQFISIILFKLIFNNIPPFTEPINKYFNLYHYLYRRNVKFTLNSDFVFNY